MVITDRKLAVENNLFKIIRESCKSGVKAIQIREKDLDSNQLLILAGRIRTINKQYKCKLIVNDRLDIALLAKAEGIHIPVNGIRLEYLKRFAPKLTAGKSIHSLNEAVKAEKDGFDYLLYGPIFRTPAKIKYGKPQGLDNLKKICSSVTIPIFAVGGINPSRAKKCIEAGAYGVAVIGAMMQSKNTGRTVNEFKNVLGEL